MGALKLPMSQVLSSVKGFFRGKGGKGLRTSCCPYTAANKTPKRTNFQAVKNSFVRCRVMTLPHRVSYWRGWVGGWDVGRVALFLGGGLSPVGQLWVVGYPTHDMMKEQQKLAVNINY